MIESTDDTKQIKQIFTLFDKHKTQSTIPSYNLLIVLELLQCSPTQYDIQYITQQLNIQNTIDITQISKALQLQRNIEQTRNYNENHIKSAYDAIKHSNHTVNVDKLKHIIKDNYGMTGLKLDDMLDELTLEKDNALTQQEFTKLFT